MDNSFSLILGCGGFEQNGIHLCGGAENVIVNFAEHIFEPQQHENLMNFLDFSCHLFDQVISDWNKIVNVLNILRSKYHLINDDKWQALYNWFPLHKRCGGYLKLTLNTVIKPQKETEVFIKPKVKSRKRRVNKLKNT